MYVRELYKVYPQLTGEDYVRPDDLDAQPKLRRDFNCQRKDYYSAETIHRELRDAIQLDENEGFCNYNLWQGLWYWISTIDCRNGTCYRSTYFAQSAG